MNELIFQDLGRMPYNEAFAYQEDRFNRLVDWKLKASAGADIPQPDEYLLFCEHPHVYTLGKSGNEANLLFNEAFLASKGATFIRTNRGGDITYHGPGQIVGYPIFDIEQRGFGVRTYIEALENAIIRTTERMGVKAGLLPGATGVWLDPHLPGKARKICAIGIKVSRGICMHGFAYNVNTDLSYFDYINPCGFTDKKATSLEKELGRKIDIDEVKVLLKKELNKVTG